MATDDRAIFRRAGSAVGRGLQTADAGLRTAGNAYGEAIKTGYRAVTAYPRAVAGAYRSFGRGVMDSFAPAAPEVQAAPQPVVSQAPLETPAQTPASPGLRNVAAPGQGVRRFDVDATGKMVLPERALAPTDPVSQPQQASGGVRRAAELEAGDKNTDWHQRRQEILDSIDPAQVEDYLRKENAAWAKMERNAHINYDGTDLLKAKPAVEMEYQEGVGYRPKERAPADPAQQAMRRMVADENRREWFRNYIADQQIAKERGYGEEISMGQTRYFNPASPSTYFSTPEEALAGVAGLSFENNAQDAAISGVRAKTGLLNAQTRAIPEELAISRQGLGLRQAALNMQRNALPEQAAGNPADRFVDIYGTQLNPATNENEQTRRTAYIDASGNLQYVGGGGSGSEAIERLRAIGKSRGYSDKQIDKMITERIFGE